MKRVIIKNISHEIENGKYPAKEIIGDEIIILSDIFCDGHFNLSASLFLKHSLEKKWTEQFMTLVSNDRWKGICSPKKTGIYFFYIEGGINHFNTWKSDLSKKLSGGNEISLDLEIGKQFFEEQIKNSKGKIGKLLVKLYKEYISLIENQNEKLFSVIEKAADIFRQSRNKIYSTKSEILKIEVASEKHCFSTWYELFPRSASSIPNKHGTFDDVIKLLPAIADQGFDVLYFPPIHPIGTTNRKGKNNSLSALQEDVGSPWAIGNKDGGHKSINSHLGTMTGFKKLLRAARKHNIEVALDIAFQCSPDHPYIKEHPEWFKWRPDGTIQFAENPPKKYEDIVPFNFETSEWKTLWQELKSIIEFWADAGVTIFRVDNPHTKSLPFWQWVIHEIKNKNVDIIFLAEAFTRPRIMEQLALAGFDQSYTYFTWRNTKDELEEYMNELTKSKMKYYFRPNFWPNTPDILPPYISNGGENAHIIRLILAATLSSNYGIYGPPFEAGLTESIKDKEEYIDNEKYEIKNWNWNRYTKIKEVIRRVNKIRYDNKALQRTNNISFARTNNENIICYVKQSADNVLIIAVNLDPHNTQEAQVVLPMQELLSETIHEFRIHDLLSGDKFIWRKENNFVRLNPYDLPAHIFKVQQISVE
jgi:starch synthase (maltosyl-transferring)